MIDFTKRGLYSRDKKKMENFKNNILVKDSERDTGVEYDDGSDGFDRLGTQTIVDSEFDFSDDFGGDMFGGDGGGFDFGSDFGFGGAEEEREDGITQRGDLSQNQEHLMFRNPILRFITSPIFLFYYVVLHTTRNNLKLRDWKNELEMMKKVNIIVAFTAVLFLLLEGRTIISPWFQLISGVILIVFSVVVLKVINGGFNKEEESSEDGLDFGEDDSGSDLFGGDDAGFSTGNDLDIFSKESTFEDTLVDLDDGENDFYEETPMEDRRGGLPKSPISVEDDDTFERDLSMVFKQSEKHMGTGGQLKSREDILNSFGPYLATNFTKFGEWKVINETSISYLNIAFTLFLALEKINNKFGRGEKKEDGSKEYGKMYINDIKENTMMYRIEFEIPEYFKLKNLTANKEEFHNVLKSSENDTEVDFLISTFRQGFVVKLFKPAKQLISLGDMLRYDDPTSDVEPPLKQFLDPKKGLPVLVGIKNNEFPVVIDYEDNTSGVIVGGSGSGKSWFTFEILENFLVGNDYHNLQMIIFDKKNAPFWNQYALTPHVIGYHTKAEQLLDICNEVYAEIDRRKELLNELGAESFKGLRAKYRKRGMKEELKRVPLLLFIVDEITSTMAELEEMDEKGEIYKSVKLVMAKITQEGRSLGVRMIAIGQRSIDKSIPKNVMANSSFKFGMKLDAESDFTQLSMDNDIKNLGVPKGMGVGIMKSMGEETSYIKTVTVGGTSDEQILNLIRAIALDWNRRSIGDEFVHETTNSFKVAYNRDKFREKAMGYLERGEIIPAIADSNLAVDIRGTGNKKDFDYEEGNFTEVEEDIEELENSNTFDFNFDETNEEVEELGSTSNTESVDYSSDMFNFEDDEDTENDYEYGEGYDNDSSTEDYFSEGNEIEESDLGNDNLEVEEDIDYSDEQTYDEGSPTEEDEDKEVGTGYKYLKENDNTEYESFDDILGADEEDDLGELDLDDLDEEDLDSLEEEEFSEVEEGVESDIYDFETVKPTSNQGENEDKPLIEDTFDDVSMWDVKELDNGITSTFDDIELEELIKTIDNDAIEKIKVQEEVFKKETGVDTTSEDFYEFDDLDDFDDFEDLGDSKEEEFEGETEGIGVIEEVKPKMVRPTQKTKTKVQTKPRPKQVQNKYKKRETNVKKMVRNTKVEPQEPNKGKGVEKQLETATKPEVKPKTKPKERPEVEGISEGKRLKTKEVPKGSGKVSQPKKQTKRVQKPENGIVFDPGGTTSKPNKARARKIPVGAVKRYIIENGEAHLNKYKIRKDKLREEFDGHTIGEALDTNTILSLDADYFVTKL